MSDEHLELTIAKNIWLLKTGEFSDFVIRCQDGKEFKVHRAIISAHSSFFDKAVTNGFKETNHQVLCLPEEESAVVLNLLLYMYTGKSHSEDQDIVYLSPPSQFLFEIRTYLAAGRYLMPGCEKRYWQLLLDRANGLQPKSDKIDEFAEVVKYVYSCTGQQKIKDLMVYAVEQSLARKNIEEPEIEPIMLVVPAFGVNMFRMRDRCDLSRLQFWCDYCEDYCRLQDCRCSCGLQGFCSPLFACGCERWNRNLWRNLKCKDCKTVGRVQLSADSKIWIDGEFLDGSEIQQRWEEMS